MSGVIPIEDGRFSDLDVRWGKGGRGWYKSGSWRENRGRLRRRIARGNGWRKADVVCGKRRLRSLSTVTVLAVGVDLVNV